MMNRKRHTPQERRGRRTTPRRPATTLSAVPTLVVAAALMLLMTWLIAPAVRPGVLAGGADTASFMLTARFMVESLRETGGLPSINPSWYAGFATYHNTPMLAYPPLALLYSLAGNIETASGWAHYLFAAVSALVIFLSLRAKYTLPAAGMGALILGASPFIIGQISEGGSYPRSLAATLGIACFYFVDKMAEEGFSARLVLPIALLLSGSLLSHPMIGGAFLVCWTLFFALRGAFGRTLSLKDLVRWLVVPAAVVGLTAWYLLPFFGERQGWVTTPYEVFAIHSVTLSRSIEVMGLPLLAILIFGLLAQWKDPTVRALFIVGVFALVLSGGVHSGVYLVIPALKAAYPWTFLLFAVTAAGVIGTSGLEAILKRDDGWKTLATILIVPILLLGVFQARSQSSAFALGRYNYENPSEVGPAKFVSTQDGDGRVTVMRFPYGSLVYWMSSLSEKNGVEGLYYSLTPTGKHISWLYDAVDHGFTDYAVDALERWNVRYLIANSNASGPYYDELFTKLEERSGFTQEFELDGNSVYVSEEPSQYFQPLRARTLLVGRFSSNAAALIPNSIVAGSINIDDYPKEVLESFDTLVLTGFTWRDRSEAERLVSEFASNGGHVVIDLQGTVVSAIEEAPNFLNVNGYINISETGFQAVAHQPTLGGVRIPTTYELPGEPRVPTAETLEDWRYSVYPGLDDSLIDEAGGDGFSILGTKELDGGGEAVFVGGGLFYHAFRTGDPAELAFVRAIMNPASWDDPTTTTDETQSRPEAAAAGRILTPVETDTSDTIRFDYESDTPAPLLVSWASSPHWKAYIDNEELDIYNVDDLMLLMLPAGAHSVEMRYENLPLHSFAWTLSLITLALLIITYRRSWYRERDSRREHAELS